MTKQLNVIFDDEDHEFADKAKGDMSWREFILEAAKNKVNNEKTSTLPKMPKQ